MVSGRQGIKSNMVVISAQVARLWLCRSLYLAGDWIFRFNDGVCMERHFNVFSVVVDILDWRPRHYPPRDHRNSKAFFFFFFFFIDASRGK